MLIDRYRIIEKRLPVFSKPKARSGRYYVRDNFLRSWLAALSAPVSALSFSPVDRLLEQADARLAVQEGYSFEKLVGALYEERSRKSLPGFQLTRRIQGYWDRADTEIDLVALDDDRGRLLLGTCKRSETKLVENLKPFSEHIERFLARRMEFSTWTIERVGIAPRIAQDTRDRLNRAGFAAQDFRDLTSDL